MDFKEFIKFHEARTPGPNLTREKIDKMFDIYNDPNTMSKAVENGLSVFAYIAKELGVQTQTIRKRFALKGIKDPVDKTMTNSFTAIKNSLSSKADEILDLYNNPLTIQIALEKGIGVFQYIAQELEISPVSVRKYLLQKGITQTQDPAICKLRSMITKKRWKNDPKLKNAIRPQHEDFWTWLSQFDDSKQIRILQAIYHREKNRKAI